MIYICEECKKKIEAPEEKWSAWIRCECGGKAFEEGFEIGKAPLVGPGGGSKYV